MANEYLKRTPTSTGNRKVFTFSVWYKRLSDNGATTSRYFFLAGDTHINLRGSGATNPDDFITNQRGQGTNYFYHYAPARRDYSSWQHLLYAVDTTQSIEKNRGRVYINGVEQLESSSLGSSNAPLNDELSINKTVAHFISEDGGDDGTYPSSLQLSDAFLVDGQALTPDVFGFYKDGDGYMSSGTTQATDFRPGQWSPRAPKSIKYTINRSGGFGVNGFYLPMNDSSNPGADFHCAPNSIIKLKGEDLPQPRNGAPTTTDAYVSELRTDPYAANLVLAVPGISTSTSANLITNGNFDSNTTGWTAVDAVLTWNAGRVQTNRTGGSGYTAYQQITGLVSGQRYTIRGWIDSTGSGNRQDLRVLDDLATNSGSILVSVSGTDNAIVERSGSFTATGTTHYVYFVSDSGGTGAFDKIVVKQEDAPRDYSADIKGSGTNKTLTAAGNAGIGYELGGYYGSAMTFDGSGDFLSIPNNSDFNYSDGGDFTIELWLYRKNTGGNDAIIGVFENSVARRGWQIEQRADEALRFQWWADGSSAGGTLDTPTFAVPVGQWTHICAERNGDLVTLYINGVASALDTSAGSFYNNTVDPLRIGVLNAAGDSDLNANIQDVRIYKGVAKYKGGFDIPKPYTPVDIESWRVTTDTCSNNFATLNSLIPSPDTSTNGNLTVAGGAGKFSQGTIGISSSVGGKWYFEFNVSNLSDRSGAVGWAANSYDITVGGYFSYRNSGTYYPPNTAYGDSWTTGDTIGIALDADNGRIFASKNGVWQNSGDPAAGTNPMVSNIFSGLTNSVLVPLVEGYGSGGPAGSFNFGQNPTFSGALTAGTNADDSGKGLFKYAPPSGFLALCEDNLPTPAIADPGKHFKSVLYHGDGNSGRSITGVGFQPDLVWLKERGPGSSSHQWHDSVRGAGNVLISNVSEAESYSATYLYSLDSDGFTLGTSGGINASTDNYVAWCWKAGGAAVSNTAGTITSQVSANQDAGFSIATWTSTGSNDALQTVGHGLDTAPNMIILKNRDAAVNWRVYHSGIPSPNNSLCLNTTEVAFNFFPSVGDDTFGLANSTTTGQSSGASGQDIVAYCWTEIEGFSKFGSYVGNGSTDGSFVYCGFKPAWIMIKQTGVNNWHIEDSSRKSINPVNMVLRANLSNPESANNSSFDIDFVSNGFKLRSTNDELNENASNYIFAAFAESPFQTANAK